jgi:hypothetical protein
MMVTVDKVVFGRFFSISSFTLAKITSLLVAKTTAIFSKVVLTLAPCVLCDTIYFYIVQDDKASTAFPTVAGVFPKTMMKFSLMQMS